MEAKQLSPVDIATDFKPTFVEVPASWQKSGARGFVDKRGNPFTIVYWVMDDGEQVGFFSDKVAKTPDGKFCIENFHFIQQVARAKAYGKK